MSTLTGNIGAFLDMIAWSEGTAGMGDDGYNVFAGSTPSNPHLFASYTDHPHQVNTIVRKDGTTFTTTAAGRYQELAHQWDAYRQQLGLPDFSPASQDAVAVQQIRETHALPLIEAGQIEQAIGLVAHLWASLPGANYPGQRMQKISDLTLAYANAGGTVA